MNPINRCLLLHGSVRPATQVLALPQDNSMTANFTSASIQLHNPTTQRSPRPL
ncbi:MAG: hypothetical protein ACI9W6_001015 [Motiliproteus sp.]|jgi:hypothetical protein